MNHSKLLESLLAYVKESVGKHGEGIACEAFAEKAIRLTFDLFDGPAVLADEEAEYACVRNTLYKYFGGNPLDFSEKLSDSMCNGERFPESRAYLEAALNRAERAEDAVWKNVCTADAVLGIILENPPPLLLSVMPKDNEISNLYMYSPLMSMIMKTAQTVQFREDKFVTPLHFVAAVIKTLVGKTDALRDCRDEATAAVAHVKRKFFEDAPKENDAFGYERLLEQITTYLHYSANVLASSTDFKSVLLMYFGDLKKDRENYVGEGLIHLDAFLNSLFEDPFALSDFLKTKDKEPPQCRQPAVEGYRQDNGLTYSAELIELLESIDRDARKNNHRRTCEELVKRVLEVNYRYDGNCASDYYYVGTILNHYFGKLPILAHAEIENYISSPKYKELVGHTLDNAHRRMATNAVNSGKRAVFAGDLLEEILSNPTKFLRDLFNSGATWGKPNIHYSPLINHLWPMMSDLPDCQTGEPTCERFLVAVLHQLDYSKPERNNRKLLFEEKRTKEVLFDALRLAGETEEVQQKRLYKLYRLVVRKVNASSVSRHSAKLFISLLVTFENQEYSGVPTSYEILRFLLKYKESPLHEYCVSGFEAEPGNESDSLAEIVSAAKRIRRKLSVKIYGQDNAINVFTTSYFRSLMTQKNSVKPKATLLFAGPPGVGKTFMAETAADALGLPFLRVDMSEYSDKEANLEFCGSDEVYRNAHEGYVTSFVSKNPKCVLLFDEIEKAHTNVIHLFLQMLDAGRLRDNYTDEEVSFSNAIIIMTTNAGRQLYENSESENLSGIPQNVIIDALAKDIDPRTRSPYFPAAICSRLASGSVVMFNHIEAAGLEQIASEELSRKKEELLESYYIETEIDENVCTALLLSEGVNTDARTIRARARAFFDNELYELLSLVAINNTKRIIIKTDIPNSEGIASLFNGSGKTSVLVFSSKAIARQCRENCGNVRIFSSQTIESAVKMIKTKEIKAVLVDPSFGRGKNTREYLNMEDVESLSRDFIRYLRDELKHLPVYLLIPDGVVIHEEEKLSFCRIGINGIIELSENFEDELNMVCCRLCRQESMRRLALENKVLTFETAQTLSEDDTCACIRLFDFKLKTAVRAEDAKDILMTRPSETFADIIGAQEAKKELSYFVEYLKNPKKYIGFGTKMPKGVLLYGPPGTGKTMLARAMACESGLTFIASEGNSFLKKYQGEGAEAVHKLFRTARKYAPAILFIDEIDAVAMTRTGDGTDSTALTALLTELDGFKNDSSRPVFVLAATNVDVKHGAGRGIDPALLRRFDRKVLVDLPTKADRKVFIAQKAEKNTAYTVTESEIDSIAMRSVGMSLAELDSMMELCLRCAIRAGSEKVTDEIFEDAFETFHSGEMKKWDESQLRRVALHESGHAVICHICGETPSYLTIVARDNHGGYMQHADNEGKAIYTKDELLGKIRTSLGGRAAELVFYGENEGVSTGSSGDIENATKLAELMVCTYGMDDEFGLGFVRSETNETSAEVRKAVNRILLQEMKRAMETISEHRAAVETLADRLMEKNHLIGKEISEVLE